jgi:hypothetical protein
MGQTVEFQIDGEVFAQAVQAADGFVTKKDDDIFAGWTLIASQALEEGEADSIQLVCRSKEGCLEITMPANVDREGMVALRSLQLKKIFKASTIEAGSVIRVSPHQFKTTRKIEVDGETVTQKVSRPALRFRGPGINMSMVLLDHPEAARDEMLEDSWIVEADKFVSSLRSVHYARESSTKNPHIAFRSIMVSVDEGAGYLAAGDGRCAAMSGLPELGSIGRPQSIHSIGMPAEAVSSVVGAMNTMTKKGGKVMFGMSSDERVLMFKGYMFRMWVLPYIVEFSAISTMRSFLEGSRQGVQYVANRSEWLRVIQLMRMGLGAERMTLYARDGEAMVEAYNDKGETGTTSLSGSSVSSQDIQPMRVSIDRLKKAVEACQSGPVGVEVARSNEPIVVMSTAPGGENDVHVLWPYVETEIDFTPTEDEKTAWEDPF